MGQAVGKQHEPVMYAKRVLVTVTASGSVTSALVVHNISLSISYEHLFASSLLKLPPRNNTEAILNYFPCHLRMNLCLCMVMNLELLQFGIWIKISKNRKILHHVINLNCVPVVNANYALDFAYSVLSLRHVVPVSIPESIQFR